MTDREGTGMGSGRLEAFSDGVLAIIITIMVLEFKAPHEATWEGLRELVPESLSYVLSFAYIGIYWNNHHHLLQAVQRVDGWTLWANLHLLFWLSLVPFTTKWMGNTSFASWPVAAYGVVLVGAALAYAILQRVLISINGADSLLAKAVGNDVKGRISLGLYAVGVAVSFFEPRLACFAYLAVALLWIRPDHRIERRMKEGSSEKATQVVKPNVEGPTMKTFAIVASMASIAAFASIPREDERPKPADELRILEDMIGEWDEELTNKTAGESTKSITKKTWALGGKFIRMDGVWNPGKNEFHSLLAFDPQAKIYRMWYFDTAGTMRRNPITAEWDAKARKMSWKAVDDGGITSVGVTTVVDKDNHHWTMKVTDKDGGVLAELVGANKRRKP